LDKNPFIDSTTEEALEKHPNAYTNSLKCFFHNHSKEVLGLKNNVHYIINEFPAGQKHGHCYSQLE